MPVLVAALDADVLVPILACDFLLTAFEQGLYEPVVSPTVLDEVERSLQTDFPHLDATAIRYRVDAMRDVLDDHIVPADDADTPGINPKDRHVVGAAHAGGASILVTNDGRLRRDVEETCQDLQALSLDAFVVGLWRDAPDETAAVVDALVAKRTRPPISRQEFLGHLAGTLPLFVDELRRAEPDAAEQR